MRGPRGITLLLGVAVLVAASRVALVVHDEHRDTSVSARRSPPSGFPDVVLGRVVHVESGVAPTKFLPLGSASDDGRTLSPQRAYDAMLHSPSLSAPIPVGVRAYYGTLSRATTPKVTHVDVWGFAVESGCVYSRPPVRSGDPTPPRPTSCRTWEFVNARTGHDLGMVTQEVARAPVIESRCSGG